MELVIDILLEIYPELMLLVIPEENASKKHILWAKIIAISVTFLLVALFVFGVILIVDYDNMWGIAPITIAAGCSLAQVIAGYYCSRRIDRTYFGSLNGLAQSFYDKPQQVLRGKKC